jgi:hypothetical protein
MRAEGARAALAEMADHRLAVIAGDRHAPAVSPPSAGTHNFEAMRFLDATPYRL